MDDHDEHWRRVKAMVEADPDIVVTRKYTFGVSNLRTRYNEEYLMLMPKFRDRLYGNHIVEKRQGRAREQD